MPDVPNEMSDLFPYIDNLYGSVKCCVAPHPEWHRKLRPCIIMKVALEPVESNWENKLLTYFYIETLLIDYKA